MKVRKDRVRLVVSFIEPFPACPSVVFNEGGQPDQKEEWLRVRLSRRAKLSFAEAFLSAIVLLCPSKLISEGGQPDQKEKHLTRQGVFLFLEFVVEGQVIEAKRNFENINLKEPTTPKSCRLARSKLSSRCSRLQGTGRASYILPRQMHRRAREFLSRTAATLPMHPPLAVAGELSRREFPFPAPIGRTIVWRWAEGAMPER